MIESLTTVINQPSIRIDPEFRDWVMPLSQEEFTQLEENLLAEGCRDALIVWISDKTLLPVLLDGHHRYAICQAHNLSYRIDYKNLPDREAAKNWIIFNQIGRRNISPAQRAYLIGKIYRETKKDHGGTGANQYTEQRANNLPSANTAERIAEQFNVSHQTVKNAEKFADAVDAIADTYGDEARDAILSGAAKMTQKDVVDTAKAFPAPAPKDRTAVPTFNQTNDNIEWARWSWNPVTGCLHDCQYCYARDIANRFYPEKFAPTFRPERLTAPKNTRVPVGADRDIGLRNVFVCSMADLFGDWVPAEWITAVIDACRDAPQWNFLFLTKNPKRLPEFEWPENAWVGTTVDCQARVKSAEEAFAAIDAPVKFVSCEPLREPIEFERIGVFDWIIIGGQSRSSGSPEMQPEWEWVERLLHQAREKQVAVYFKPNLIVRPREYPGGI